MRCAMCDMRCWAGAPREQAAGGGAVRGGQPGVARRGRRGGAAGAPGRAGRAARAQAAARAPGRRAPARESENCPSPVQRVLIEEPPLPTLNLCRPLTVEGSVVQS